MAKAINYKTWCINNITPQSWSRIVLKSIPELRDSGFTLNELENPSETLELDESTMDVLNKWLNELYDIQIAQEALV